MDDPRRREWWFSGGEPTRADRPTSGASDARGGVNPPGDADQLGRAGPGARPANPSYPAPSGHDLPPITLPKGGGAVRGIDEKLTVDQATGAGQLTVPVFTSPARAGGGPKLALAYSSGSGNGLFGLGWSLGVAAITRKTSKGLPRYDDASDSDVFILAGVEELVPLLVESGTARVDDRFSTSVGGVTFDVRRYRPRVEAGFARIERWQNSATGEVHWRTVTRDNVTSLFGQDSASRIADPDDPQRVFSWLIDLSFDDRGNAIAYQYKPEDVTNVPRSASELGRTVTANRYLKRILYGNETPYPGTGALPADWCFELVLDYGEHDLAAPAPSEATAWPCRPDPFSTYRSGFELRTYRRCRRILMFHTFPTELGADPVVVRSTDLAYVDPPADPRLPVYSLLSSVTQTGWLRPSGGGAYQTAQLPPLELTYAPLNIDDTLRSSEAESLANAPGDFDGTHRRWVDLLGEGLPGILTEDDGAWYYKRNLSAGTDGATPGTVALAPLEQLATKPTLTPDNRGLQLTSLNGDGRLTAVNFAAPVAGWFELNADGRWEPLRELAVTANVDWNSPNLRFLDIDGDGLADVLITEDEALSWHRWIAELGFAAADRVAKPFDEDLGPALVFADGTGTVLLADMSGDGLTDLVRVRNGEVCYWPNRGYGRFGAKVTMDAAPVFDAPDQFDARRLRMADIDGSGTADLVYLGSATTTIWFNQSGSSFTAGRPLPQFPPVDDVAAASAFDLLGTGTAAMVWTSPLPADATEPLRYIDLTGSSKPYLLTGVTNNLGASATLSYAPSTRFYLEDQAAGNPWLTRLPFPVQVVTRVESNEAISRTRLVSTYTYHHGFYDPTEREFRGFARVDQLDAEAVAGESGTGEFTGTPALSGDEYTLPPVWTRSWYHTGAFFDREDIATGLRREYYAGDTEAPTLLATALPADATAEELREACRALRGRPLRQEVYAQDGTSASVHPYTVTEHRYEVDRLQPSTDVSYGAFHAWEMESLTVHYERDPTDPRVSHDLTLALDAYGNVTRSASVGYPRRSPAFPEQGETLVVYTEADWTNVADQPAWYRLGLPVETRVFELTGVAPGTPGGLYDHDSLASASLGAQTIAYEQTPSGGPQRRLLKRRRTIYRKDDLSAALSVGQVESLALVDRTYVLVYTAGLLDQLYVQSGKLAQPALATILSTDCQLADLDSDGNQWAPSARALFSPDPAHPDATYARQHFYLVQGMTDPWGNTSTIGYAHDLLINRHQDALGNVTSAQHNYRLLQPWLVTDANLNRFGARFDELGRLTTAAAMGKRNADGSDEVDHLDLGSTETSPSDDPTVTMAYSASAYWDWLRDPAHDPSRPVPTSAHARVRVTHKDPASAWLESYTYSDGFGRVAMAKAQAEPGAAPERDAQGALVHDAQGSLAFAPTKTRWVGTGRIVHDNKGNAVKAYEPFFDSSPAYAYETELVQWGVTAIVRYDPLSRAVRVDNPDGTYRSVAFTPWQVSSSDENDNVLDSSWYAARNSGGLGLDQQDAATKAAAHANTPSLAQLDSLGRTFRSVQDNGAAGQYATVLTLDIEAQVRVTTDALARQVLTSDFDLAGRTVHHVSADAGEQWLLYDALGRAVMAWDSRGTQVRREYDALGRPAKGHVTEAGGQERVAEQFTYGEALAVATAQSLNLLGACHERRDESGLVTTDRRDFKGNVLSTTGQLLADYRGDVDWSQAPALDSEQFTNTASYDALNRPLTRTTPDGSQTTNSYGERSLIASVEVQVRGGSASAFLSQAEYDAKGRPLAITHGNGAALGYTYDSQSLRLTELKATRPAGASPVQDLTYSYDPVGNITRANDGAQSTIFFNNQVVTPDTDYTYDPLYRLTRGQGREHIGQQAQTTWDDSSRTAVPLPTDGQAMRNYTENYSYDSVGNITQVAHSAANGSWNRAYAYDEPQPAPRNGHLSSTTVVAREPYSYDAHGNVTSMPHLTRMEWDWRNQLEATARQVVNAGTPETTYYRYGASGQRVRKVTESQNGVLAAERVYLGDYEVYREYTPAGAVALERQCLYVGDGTCRLALVETQTLDGGTNVAAPMPLVRYQYGNHIGSAVAELDSAGAVISYEEYYPFGSTSFQRGRSAAEVSLKRYRYIGKERDTETGFYHIGLRYYAPWLGRWISPDPLGFVDGINLYRYCANNPVSHRDVSGTQREHSVKVVGVPGHGAADEARGRSLLGQSTSKPEDVLRWAQTHGYPWLSRLPTWNPGMHMWVFPQAMPAQGSAGEGGAGGAGGTPAASAPAAKKEDRSGEAPTATTGREVLQEAARPQSVTGERPQGTLHLWSGEEGKAEAKGEIARKGTGWMMGDIKGEPTPQHAAGKQEFADAIAAARKANPALPPGQELAQPEVNRIWGPRSAEVVGRGAFAGHPVEAHGTPRAESIQVKYEWPARGVGGGLAGGLGVASGLFTAIMGGRDPNPAVAVPLVMSGVLEATSGITYGAGAITGSAEAMAIGSAGMTFFGGAGAAIGFGVAAYRSWERGDTAGWIVNGLGAIGGVLMIASLFTPVGWVGLLGLGLVALASGFNIGRWLAG